MANGQLLGRARGGWKDCGGGANRWRGDAALGGGAKGVGGGISEQAAGRDSGGWERDEGGNEGLWMVGGWRTGGRGRGTRSFVPDGIPDKHAKLTYKVRHTYGGHWKAQRSQRCLHVHAS